jgi:hypothetical protein
MASARRRTGGAVSSAVLYLAIVALWAVVLVPMWLRRDNDATRHGLSWLPHRRPMTFAEQPAGETQSPTEEPGHAPEHGSEHGLQHGPQHESEHRSEPGPVRRRRGRGAVMARRRRRTAGLSLLIGATVGCGLAGLIPYWSVLPPAGLLAGHLALLRVAADIDAARREALAQARAAERAAERAAAHAAREAAEAAQAEIIDLMARNRARDVFDQYAHEGLRVVGD